MTDKIKGAADLIQSELAKRGHFISDADAYTLARRLYALWSDRHEIVNLPAGEIAQKHRERYGE